MQQVPTESSNQIPQSNPPIASTNSTQDGFSQHDPADLSRDGLEHSRSHSPCSVIEPNREVALGLSANQLNERLRGISLGPASGEQPPVPGQRISDYENALTPPAGGHTMGFKVIKRHDTRSDGTQLEDFPNGKVASLMPPHRKLYELL
jgi:hypothetical protein